MVLIQPLHLALHKLDNSISKTLSKFMTYDLIKDGFVVLDYDENISEYLQEIDKEQIIQKAKNFRVLYFF